MPQERGRGLEKQLPIEREVDDAAWPWVFLKKGKAIMRF